MSKPVVAILMGSKSDLKLMEPGSDALEELGIPHEVRVLSAHRTPARTREFAEAARDMGAFTIGLTGGTGGKMAGAVDLLLAVPSAVTARIQEAHILIEHILCEAIDERFSED